MIDDIRLTHIVAALVDTYVHMFAWILCVQHMYVRTCTYAHSQGQLVL